MGEPSKARRWRGIHDYTFLQNAEGTPLNNEVSFLFYRPMGHAGQSFRLACLAGKNPGV